MLIKMGRIFGGIIVLKVYYLDRLSHDQCTENFAVLYIDPDYFSQHDHHQVSGLQLCSQYSYKFKPEALLSNFNLIKSVLCGFKVC